MKTLIKLAALSLAFAVPAAFAEKPDLAREDRLTSQIADAIMDGDVSSIDVDGREVFTIDMEAESSPAKGTVIILHGRGLHADWQDTISPLRIGLTSHGWNTSSVQMPVLDKEAKYYDYVKIFDTAGPRIEAAIKAARENGGKVVLLAHSCGAHMAMEWVWNGGKGMDAYVGVGMGATDYKQPMKRAFPLDKMDMPVLDIYGEKDYPSVKRLAKDRLALIEKAGNTISAQKTVAGSDHYHKENGDALVESVAEWLATLK